MTIRKEEIIPSQVGHSKTPSPNITLVRHHNVKDESRSESTSNTPEASKASTKNTKKPSQNQAKAVLEEARQKAMAAEDQLVAATAQLQGAVTRLPELDHAARTAQRRVMDLEAEVDPGLGLDEEENEDEEEGEEEGEEEEEEEDTPERASRSSTFHIESTRNGWSWSATGPSGTAVLNNMGAQPGNVVLGTQVIYGGLSFNFP
ncbi:uncharacterized protein BDV14DRAFT_196270 [Aspergillus stella-maris]|uniref:uncharacterized protein n=1 Tax=Aspergillus stella-maris TaxID=1810926 RepID=UPI003CCE47FD